MTLSDLILAYRTDKRSPYHGLRFKTRENYDGNFRRVEAGHGEKKLSDLKEPEIQSMYDGWAKGGETEPMAHALIGVIRRLANFGDTVLNDIDSQRLALVLHRMQFAIPKPRKARLTEKHVADVIAMGHELKLHSISLAQAIQADCKLRQKDVIGEYVPQASPDGESDVKLRDEKWIRGLRWDNIDRSTLILRHTTSKQLKDVTINLRKCARVMAEFARIGELPSSGPMIICEYTGYPWTTLDFRRQWRRIARAAGVPDEVRYMDSTSLGDNDSDEDGDDRLVDPDLDFELEGATRQ